MGKFIDLTGQKFGRLTVIKRAENIIEPSGKSVVVWECQCECGKKLNISGKSLRSGNTKSCGCLFSSDLCGKKYGRLTVLEKAEPLKHPGGKQSTRWKCQCECGNVVVIQTQVLKKGKSKSCGCFRKEYSHDTFLKHGRYKSKIYKIYLCILSRCYYEGNKSYKNYGGRGIKVCDQWLGKEGFLNFCEWSYKNGFDDSRTSNEQSIDRIDVNGNYEPLNCRWATQQKQQNNKRNNLYITYNSKTQSLADWCRELNIPYSRTQQRHQRGWSVEKMFNEPGRFEKQ